MKNKELALKISKHPLMDKVAKLEDKRVVARLVIEELLRESSAWTKERLEQEVEKEKKLSNELLKITYNSDKGKAIYKIFDYTGNNVKGNTNNLGINMVKGVDASEPETYLPCATYNLNDGMYYINNENVTTLIKNIKKSENSIKTKASKVIETSFDNEKKIQYYKAEKSPTTIIFKKIVAEPQQGDDEATEVTATPEQQKQVQQAVIKVEDSLKDFFKYLKNKITGGAEVPGEEETIEEGLFDNIKKGLERRPGKAKDTFFKLLSKYLKDANVGIDLSPKEIESNWDEWSLQSKKAREASKIIAAYTYHFNIFGNKPELTGELIQDAAKEIVVGGKSKLDQFIEEIVGIAVDQFKEGLEDEKVKEDFLNTSFGGEEAEYPYDTIIEYALKEKLKNNQEAIDKLMNNKKFTDPAYELLEKKLKELHAEMFFEPNEEAFKEIADVINKNENLDKDDFSVTAIKKLLNDLLNKEIMSDLFNSDEEIKKHIKYLLEEDKRIADFIFKYITYPNTREDFKSLKPALKKLAIFLKKSEDYSLKESLRNLSNRFEGDFNKIIIKMHNSGMKELPNSEALDNFFKFQNNLDYFVKYFFGKDELEEPEENKDENYTYSYLVLIALNNQTKKREAELKSYFSALKKRVDKLTKDNEKPQAEKYANLKKESVFLISKLKAYNSIIKNYMDYRKNTKEGSDITEVILVDFGNNFPDSEEIFKLIRWTDKSENVIQYEDKTIPASEVYLKDIEKWEELSGSEKAKAFLYDYRTLIRDKEDGEIKRFIDRVNRIDDQIRSGKEPAPRDEEADDAIPKERYEYFLQEAKPIAKFLQETPITFGDNKLNFGDDKLLPVFNKDQGNLKNLVIQLNRNEFNKTKLFKYIGSPQDPYEAKNRILKTIETLKAFQQAKNDGLADDEVAYDAFIGEVKDNLTYFQMGWPLFQSTGRGVKLNTPYEDNTNIENMFSDEQLKGELVRMANMEGKQVKAAIKSKYSRKDDEQKKLIQKLNELTKERNLEIARDCANIYETHKMKQGDYRDYRKDPNFKNQGEKRYEQSEWKEIKRTIENIIIPFFNNHVDAALPDIQNKQQYEKFLNAYKAIVQKANTRGLQTDVTKNPMPQDQSKIDFQEQLTKLIKPLIREKLKRKQNGKKNLRN